MPVHKLLHPNQGTLQQELEHARIVVSVVQPVGKVVVGDAIAGTDGLLRLNYGLREVDASRFTDQVNTYGCQEQGQCPRKHCLVRGMAEQREQHSHQGVEHQNIAAPYKHQMQEAYQRQHPHAPVEDKEAVGTFPGSVGNDDGEADAEQQGEEGVELAVYQVVKQPAHYLVRLCRG